jgi:hypothetical protein
VQIVVVFHSIFISHSTVGISNKSFMAYCTLIRISFKPISKIHCAGGRLCHPLALWFRGGGRAPASKASHFFWHKTASGCCVCQHKCVLAANTNRFWPSAHSIPVCFEPISKIHCVGGCLCHPLALWFMGGGRAPASKDSHFSWHKTTGGCCAR